MSIRLQCPGCGKRYRFDEQVAGKKARCPCGRTIEIPGPACDAPIVSNASSASAVPPVPDAPPPPEALHAPKETALSHARAWPGESASAEREDLRSTVSQLAAAGGGDASPRKPAWQAAPPRTAVGILSIVYGAGAALYLLAALVSATSSGRVGLSTTYLLVWLAFAVVMAYGGVLVLKRHAHGHVYTGLSCAIVFFLPLVSAVCEAFRSLSAIQPGVFLAVVLKSVLLYTIPVLIVVWSVQEEARREAEPDRLD